MSLEDKKRMVAVYKELYESSNMPISILDRSLSIVWSNSQVDRLVGRLFRTSISRLLDEEQKNEIFSFVRDGKTKTIVVDNLADFPLNLSFSPLYLKDGDKKINFEFYMVIYTKDEFLKRPDTLALETVFAEVKRNLNDISVYKNAILSRLREANIDPGNEVYSFFDKILNSGCSILRIIDDFSYYAGIVAGTNSEKKIIIECSKYLDGFFHGIKTALKQKNRDFRYSIDIDDGNFICVEPSKFDRGLLALVSIIEKDISASLNSVRVYSNKELERAVIEFSIDYNSNADSFIKNIKKGVMERYNIDDVSKFILKECLNSTGGQVDFEMQNNGRFLISISYEMKDVPEKIVNDITSFAVDNEVLFDVFSDINIGLSGVPFEN